MKKALFILLAIVLFGTGCEEDNPTLPEPDLNYDGPNQSAPFLPDGTHEAAVRFPASETGLFTGQELTAVDFFLQSVPFQTIVRIYGEGTDSSPGQLLHEQNLSTGVTPNSWNRYNLTTPVPITGEDLWISVLVEHNERLASIGCDPGPAVANGDWLLAESRNNWTTLRQYSNQGIDINWNIRGFVGN